jgi:hypothetical protein
MVIAGDRQHMVVINHPNYLKYVMCFDANGARAWTVKRTTGVQPAASNIELRTVASSKVLPHPPAARLSPLQLVLIPLLSLAFLFDKLFPNQPTPDEDNSIH